MATSKTMSLRKTNNVLSVIAIILALYLILIPFVPQIWWAGKQIFNKPDPALIKVTGTVGSKNTSGEPIPSGYWLDIPRLSLHRNIGTDSSVSQLDKGPWHVYGTATPDKGSNTVIAGHRFGFTSPFGPFYFLDKLQTGDRVTVDWNGTEYTYKVIGAKTVHPDNTTVQAATKNPQLTLYTCTPLWSAKDRLVVISQLVGSRTQ